MNKQLVSGGSDWVLKKELGELWMVTGFWVDFKDRQPVNTSNSSLIFSSLNLPFPHPFYFCYFSNNCQSESFGSQPWIALRLFNPPLLESSKKKKKKNSNFSNYTSSSCLVKGVHIILNSKPVCGFRRWQEDRLEKKIHCADKFLYTAILEISCWVGVGVGNNNVVFIICAGRWAHFSTVLTVVIKE